MSSVLVKDLKGKEVGKKELAPEVFGMEPNMHLVHAALVRQLANARSGSANCKTRAEVRGGGRKPWRQKGTGRARAGSTRSPLWNGGGVTFGPKPRDYSITMPKKSRQLALKSALVARADELVVIQNFDGLFNQAPKADSEKIEQPKTKAMQAVLTELGIIDKNVLIVLDRMVAGSAQVERSARNLPNVRVVDQTNLNVKDLAHCQALLVTEQVLAELENRFKAVGSTRTAESAESKEAPKKKETSKKEAPAKEEAAPAAKKAASSDAVAKAKSAAKAAAEAVSEAKASKAPAAEEKKTSTKKAAPEAKAEEKPEAPKKSTKKKSEDA